MNVTILILGLIIMVSAGYLWLRNDNASPWGSITTKEMITLYMVILGMIVFSVGLADNLVNLAKS